MSRNACSSIVEAAGAKSIIVASKGYLHGVVITTDLTNDVVVLVEDGAAEMMTLRCPGTEDCKNIPFATPVRFGTNLSVTVTGTGGQATFFIDQNG